MIVSTCGFGSTGSSAVSDYLKECENTCVLDEIEFDLASMPDGLEDLEYHLMLRHSRLKSSVYAFQRFKKNIQRFSKSWCTLTKIDKETLIRLTDEFIESISQISFVGFSPSYDRRPHSLWRRYFGYSFMLQRLIPGLERRRILKKNVDFYPLERINASIAPDNFYDEARKYVKSLLETMGCDFSKTVVLDQGFSGDDPVKSFNFYEDPYAIVVDRDPRDLYIFAKKFLLSRGRFMPTEDVQSFIAYYRMLRDGQPYKKKNDRVLKINFEEMVYDYDNTTKRINSFLNVVNKQPKTIFIPEISVANTNLIRKFPEFEEDIKVIERELSDYLFPFEQYHEIQGSTTMFCGKSPLNK